MDLLPNDLVGFDDDIIDVIIVLSVLTVGVVGGIVLLIKYVAPFRRFCWCAKEAEEEVKPFHHPQRSTIRVIRKPNIVHAEQGRAVIPAKAPVSRVRSAPAQPSFGTLPAPICSPPPSAVSSEGQKFVFIVPKTPTYRLEMASHQLVSPQSSHSTASTYLPAQIGPQPQRRGSL